MQIDVNKPCIICGHADSKEVFATYYPDYDYPGTFTINLCTNCGLYFNSPRLADDSIAALYDQNYYFFHRRAEIEFQRMVGLYQRTLGVIANEVTDKKVLEIGSAKGYFLAVLKELGWDVNGIEISKSATNFTKRTLKVPAFTGQLEDYAQTFDAQYPVVLAIDLIEHVTNPDMFVENLARVTETGGQVLIATPNGDSANIDKCCKNWPGFNPFHIYIFSKSNLEALLNKHGFVIEKTFSYDNKTLDPTPPPQKSRSSARALAKLILKGMGGISMIKSIRLWLWRLQSHHKLSAYLDRAVRDIDNLPSYFDTEDSMAELADNIAGDNLVIFARRVK